MKKINKLLVVGGGTAARPAQATAPGTAGQGRTDLELRLARARTAPALARLASARRLPGPRSGLASPGTQGSARSWHPIRGHQAQSGTATDQSAS